MSAITIDNDLVHYEVLGRGRPVILLHGWLSSWRYWVPTMQQLSMKYRTYALDLWGYGDSGKDAERLSLEAQVRLLGEFMDRLGIGKAALVGHSLGSAVMIRYALRNTDRVARLMAISPPIFEYGPDKALPAAGADPAVVVPADVPAAAPATIPAAPPIADPAEAEPRPNRAAYDAPTQLTRPAAMQHDSPTVLNRPASMDRHLQEGNALPEPDIAIGPDDPLPPVTEPAAPPPPANSDPAATQEIAAPLNPLRDRLLNRQPRDLLDLHFSNKDSAEYARLVTEVAKTAPGAYAASVLSFDRIDLAHDVRRLDTLALPTLLVYGDQDGFINAPSDELVRYLGYSKSNFRCVIWPETDHFPMLDDPAAFHRLVMDFLETRDLTTIDFKERWKRKIR
ncbi:MAG: alpha/beta fold hydrolase [Anaerolineae bacterium]|nr:alpha/beta fold hydrolase [Anaerolineae bacterium]